MRQSATASSLLAIVLIMASSTINVFAAPTPGELKPIEARQANVLTANPIFDEPWETAPSASQLEEAAAALKEAGAVNVKRSGTANPKFDEPWLSGSRDDAANALKKAGGGK
ncbi:hypothetical protein V8F20_008790 [Naviculisporaceae sp. PSN 640]